jgi:DNA primase large subunit
MEIFTVVFEGTFCTLGLNEQKGTRAMPVEDLRQSPMMNHLLEALDRGEDIGHYGRLTFVMIARHFVSNDELVELLTKDRDADEQEIRALVQQVEEKGYSPPRRDRVLEWQSQQDFQICPNPDDPDACNVYNELSFPDEVYESIQEYQEKRQTADS